MTKPREKTREELTAEIEDGKKKIQQFENREKMLRQKLSKEKRRTRSHHLIVRGAVFESIVPEAKNMTDEEATALLRLALTSQPAREFLRKRAGNAQLAREIDAALPIELSREEQIRLVREYCSSQFVSRGMCVDFAIHDTDSGNPHCHIMLTMRPLDERGAWAAKSKKEYDLDENGERIRLPSGRYKTHKWKPCSQKKHAERKRLLKERENLLRNLRRKEIRSVQRSRQKQKLEILKLWQNIKQSSKKVDRTTVRELKKMRELRMSDPEYRAKMEEKERLALEREKKRQERATKKKKIALAELKEQAEKGNQEAVRELEERRAIARERSRKSAEKRKQRAENDPEYAKYLEERNAEYNRRHTARRKEQMEALRARAEAGDQEAQSQLAERKQYQVRATVKSYRKMRDDALSGDPIAKVRYEKTLAMRREAYHAKKSEQTA